MAALTQLGPSATPARPYGAWTRTPSPAVDRSGLGPYTQLGARGPQARYGSFTGKAEISADAKYPTETVRPILTVGQLSAVDLDTDETLTPRLVETAVVGRPLTSSDTVRPVFTVARGAVTSYSAEPSAGSDTLTPVLGVVVLLTRAVPSAVTLTPVLSIASSADTTAIEKLSAVTVTPVLSVAAVSLDLSQAVASSDTITPVLSYNLTVERLSGQLDWHIADSLNVRFTVVAQVRDSGDVDHIEITLRPRGTIRITPA